ncbi:MAG: MoaF C-terminal domain-containing protein [Pelagibacterium sp.]|uniref:MoaF C-terminal domain-containing protein n=1 Tax=Pelagibacterium sp. TaxID=1967288 RepID=UPI0032EE07A8
MTAQPRPADWKNYEDFADGIDHNRLPRTDALVGMSFALLFTDGRELSLRFEASDAVTWTDDGASDTDWCEVIAVAQDTYFIDLVFKSRPRESDTLVVNTRTGRVLSIYATIRSAEEAKGDPRVDQAFRPGTISGISPSAPEPAETRDLIGLRAHFTYSPNHVYEHTYLSSKRYAWQNLVGVQRGQGDVDMATTYKFDDSLYVFTFREFLIPVASIFFYNLIDNRSTGKFLGITGDGAIANNPAGAFIRKASMTYYSPGQEPV